MAVTETEETIGAWAEATFGPPANLEIVARRAEKEIKELIAACAVLDRAKAEGAPAHILSGIGLAVAMEAADVGILLKRICGLVGERFDDQVDYVMRRNRRRKWISNGDGTGQHVDR